MKWCLFSEYTIDKFTYSQDWVHALWLHLLLKKPIKTLFKLLILVWELNCDEKKTIFFVQYFLYKFSCMPLRYLWFLNLYYKKTRIFLISYKSPWSLSHTDLNVWSLCSDTACSLSLMHRFAIKVACTSAHPVESTKGIQVQLTVIFIQTATLAVKRPCLHPSLGLSKRAHSFEYVVHPLTSQDCWDCGS